jgi:hypothetical protein
MVMRTLALVFGAATQLLSAQPAPEQPGGPLQLIVTYRCPPPRRAAFRQFMIENGIQRFEHWKQDGLLRDYRFLFNWYAEVDTWEAMAVLSFPSYDRLARWKEIEHASPGGLSRDALELALPVSTTSADLIFDGTGEGPFNRADAVYFVMPFDNADFRTVAGSLLVPQMKGLVRSGAVSSYQIFSNRYPGGKRWRGMMLVEYKDMEAFGHRQEAVYPGQREPVVADGIVGH